MCRSGDYYKGTFLNGSPGPLGQRGEVGPGDGYMTFANGDVYYGEFEAGVPHGSGQMRFGDGDVVEVEMTQGRWSGTRMNGNGDEHRGSFLLNEPEGSGRIIFAKGGVFDGSFEEGRFEFEVDSGEVSERGQFRDGFLDGRGRRAFGREVYEGEFKCSLYHGAGVLRMEVIGVSARHG